MKGNNIMNISAYKNVVLGSGIGTGVIVGTTVCTALSKSLFMKSTEDIATDAASKALNMAFATMDDDEEEDDEEEDEK